MSDSTFRKTCPCGSGEQRSALNDARGIFCCFYCSQCETAKRSKYRPEVLTNANYYTDEPVEPDGPSIADDNPYDRNPSWVG